MKQQEPADLSARRASQIARARRARWASPLRAALPWVVTGALSVVITLATIAPAAWVAPWVAQATQGRMRLLDAAGSLWHGSATLALASDPDAQNATVLPGRVAWRTAFWPLCAGRLHVTLHQTEAMPADVALDANLDHGELSAGSARLPASLLNGLGSPFNTLDLQADVRVQWSDWRWFGQRAFGHLDVTASETRSRISRVEPLGTYRMSIQAQGADALLDLSTLKGPLLLSGQGTLSARGLTFAGLASASAEQRENLAGLLNLLGRPAEDGRGVRLQYGDARQAGNE